MAAPVVQGHHLNCDLDPHDPLYVCTGHKEKCDGLYKLQFIATPSIPRLQKQKDCCLDAVLMVYTSRPAHNHRLLNTQVWIQNNAKHILNVLVRKYPAQDTSLYIELWVRSSNEPFSLEACTCIQLVPLLLRSTHNKPHVLVFKETTNEIQGTITLQNVRSHHHQPILMVDIADHAYSLSHLRGHFNHFQYREYLPVIKPLYQQYRPNDASHWYTYAPTPHANALALVTTVYETRHVSFTRTFNASQDRIWRLIFDLAYMQVFQTRCPSDEKQLVSLWNNQLSVVKRGQIINYMLSLPLTGFTYVNDYVWTEKNTTGKLDADIWTMLRTRPLALDGVHHGVSFDCEDASLYILESIFVFQNAKFQPGSILEAIQETLVKEYQAWFTLCQLKVHDSEYETHAVVVLTHAEHSIVVEGTTLTSGVWDDDDKKQEGEEEEPLFTKLEKIAPSVNWRDMIQYSTPMSEVKSDVLYKSPITMVSAPRKGVVQQRIFDENVTDMASCVDFSIVSRVPYTQWDTHPDNPPDFQPISWFDCRMSPEVKLPDPYRCACSSNNNNERKHKKCYLYYTSLEFYEKNEVMIKTALQSFQYDICEFNTGREVCLMRICVCVWYDFVITSRSS